MFVEEKCKIHPLDLYFDGHCYPQQKYLHRSVSSFWEFTPTLLASNTSIKYFIAIFFFMYLEKRAGRGILCVSNLLYVGPTVNLQKNLEVLGNKKGKKKSHVSSIG